jgi:diguanylate cyclase (GGDEF)-like protein
MKKKNIIFITIALIVIAALFGTYYFVFQKEETQSTLTLSEKTWIENNKNKIIDIGVVNEIAILNYSGEGLFFNFLEDIEDNTNLEFNKISYPAYEKIEDEYAFKRVNKVSKNDILVYSDNYVLIGKDSVKFNNLNELDNELIGVLQDDLSNVSKYLNNDKLQFQALDSIDSLLNSLLSEENELKYVVMPKLVFLSNIENRDGLYINYNITEMKDNYVISLGKDKTLNNIIEKYYDKWKHENFEDEYAVQFTNMYFKINEVDEKNKVKFRSKRYTYGFVNNAPFDMEINNKLVGINSSIIKRFSELSNVEISYKGYLNTSKLLKDFKENKIDFFFNAYNNQKYDMDTFNTVSTFNEEIVILSNIENNVIINSEMSLDKYTALVVSKSKIENELKSKDIKVKSYKNINALMNAINKNSIVVVDKETYEFYKNSGFKNFKINHIFNLEDQYTYLIRDVKNNQVFEQFFNYYLQFVNEEIYINEGFNRALTNSSNNDVVKFIGIAIGSLFGLLIIFFLGNKLKPNKPKKRKLHIKKEDKVKYIDMLTSLKNRNYLNERIEIWDDSEVYPQSIVIVDLNNIAYINDNYGHQEGDNVIKQAANILITNQVPNSDIIRTNGNEFLIYMVGYNEKQVVSYIKKLNKEFKELAHGFGAAAGYSMITDGIKTIDDAVNEATLDMRNNKEELNN